MTPQEFFDAYNRGQRHFINLEFEYLEGFTDKDFSDSIFQHCFLYIDFRGSNFTNAHFISCNLKEIDLRNTNLTNALMKNCLVECAMFKGAQTNGFQFIENYYYGLMLGQQEFDRELFKSDSAEDKSIFVLHQD